jgi:hypothetical protein
VLPNSSVVISSRLPEQPGPAAATVLPVIAPVAPLSGSFLQASPDQADGSSPRWDEATLRRRNRHPGAQAYLQRRTAAGDTPAEALRALKRRLSDIVYRTLLADSATAPLDQAA